MLLPNLRTAVTPTPRPHVTQAALLEDRIQKRTLDTCGWISGNSALPIACPAGYSCQANVRNGFACCNDVHCSADWHTCQAHGQMPVCGNLDESICSSIYTSILTCGSDAPWCVPYELSASLNGPLTLTSLGCATASDPILMLGSITNAGSGATATQKTAQPSGIDTIASPTNDFTSPTTTTGSGTNFGTGSTGNSTTTTTKAPLSTAIIVVIVVVGIALIAAIGLGICICYKCMGKRRTESYKTRLPTGPGEFEPEPTELSDSVSRTSRWVDNSGPPGYVNVPALPPRSEYSGTTAYGGYRI